MLFKNKYSFPKNRKIILCWLLPIQVLFYKVISLFPDAVEHLYSNGLFSIISKVLRTISRIISLPIGQFLIISVIIYIVIWVTQLIKEKASLMKKVKRLLISLTATLSIIYLAFMLLWGFNYSRLPLAEILKYEDVISTSTELEKVCKLLIQKTNAARLNVSKDENKALNFEYNWGEMTDNCVEGFSIISKGQSEFEYSTPSVKEVVIPQSMSYLGIGGIYFPFTGEANVNSNLPSYSIPFTTCHEMAHQIGFAKEDEANFVSYLACTNHADKRFIYSGYLAMLKYTLSELRYQDYEKYEILRKSYSKGLIMDLKDNNEYWEQFETPLANMSSDINDIYLKANNQEDGVDSYNLVVQLLIKKYRKEGVI